MSQAESLDSYSFKGEQLDTILELCAGAQSQVGERYRKHRDLALEKLTDTIQRMLHDKLGRGSKRFEP